MKERKSWEIMDTEKQMSFGDEFSSVHRINLEGIHPLYKTAYEKSQEVVLGNRIRINNFPDHRDCERDKRDVIRKIEEINSKSHEQDGRMEALVQSEILETMLYVFSKDFCWFGESTSGILPSLYDDLFLGNDLILEHKVGGLVSHTGLGIDITLGEESTLDKLENARNRVKRGELGKVKYFQSPDGKYTGQLNNIPHFIVGVDRDNLFKLIDLWLKDKTIEIKNHPAQVSLLTQMITQCDYFISILRDKISGLVNSDDFQKEKLSMSLRIYVEEKDRLVKTLEERKTILTEKGVDFRNYKDKVSQAVDFYTKRREGLPDKLD